MLFPSTIAHNCIPITNDHRDSPTPAGRPTELAVSNCHLLPAMPRRLFLINHTIENPASALHHQYIHCRGLSQLLPIVVHTSRLTSYYLALPLQAFVAG